MANRDRHKTLEECVGRRQVTRERRESVSRGLVARKAAVCLGGGAPGATAVRYRLEPIRRGEARDVLAGVAAHPRRGGRPHPRGGSLARGGLGSVPEGHHGTTTPQKAATPTRCSDRHVPWPSYKRPTRTQGSRISYGCATRL